MDDGKWMLCHNLIIRFGAQLVFLEIKRAPRTTSEGTLLHQPPQIWVKRIVAVLGRSVVCNYRFLCGRPADNLPNYALQEEHTLILIFG
jgi:hypothetical protein